MTETTIYISGILEKVTRSGVTEYRHRIEGGNGTAAIYTRRTSGTPLTETYYVHRDHLGSPELITNAAGAVVVRLSFGAYGERRDSDWDGAVSSADMTAIGNTTRRGFTGHEHLDSVNLIHMNGRVFEPIIGRMLSPDAVVQVGAAQSLNPYSYVSNQPLSAVDPSGWLAQHLSSGSHYSLSRADGGGGGGGGEDWGRLRQLLFRASLLGRRGPRLMWEPPDDIPERSAGFAYAAPPSGGGGAGEPTQVPQGTEPLSSDWTNYLIEGAGWALVAFDVANSFILPTPDTGIYGLALIGGVRAAKSVSTSSELDSTSRISRFR